MKMQITQRSLSLHGRGVLHYYSLRELADNGSFSLDRLPYCLRILLESVLRNADNEIFTMDHVQALSHWEARSALRKEVPFRPARVLLQDFTGVPVVVDLAAMRDIAAERGKDPALINPIVPCDLVIDHSVQVDYFGTHEAQRLNEELEVSRNLERYRLLKWGQQAFSGLRIIPPGVGICHQVNLEFLASVVVVDNRSGCIYPDTCVGTDSHTPMTNGIGVLSWGIGGIEAEAALLAQPLYLALPDVVGIRLAGELKAGVTATDLVLRITEMCRQANVVGKFVEFYGPGAALLSAPDRATVANMAPEQGSTVSFFPVDDETLRFLRMTGRSAEDVDLVERYMKEQGLFRSIDSIEPDYTATIELDLSTVEPSISGPKRPQDRIPLAEVSASFKQSLSAAAGLCGYGLGDDDQQRCATLVSREGSHELTHGAVVVAAITSCTNTSNPAAMLAAGLVAKRAVEKGLKVPSFVKTSLAPGSRVVTEYLSRAGLLPYLESLGFHVVGYGCMTCIGNSGPLAEEVVRAVEEESLVVAAVLSGNRNFEGRVHASTRANYLASPPLVVAYALAGSVTTDLTRDPLGRSADGSPVFLRDIWPGEDEIRQVLASTVSAEVFCERYADAALGSKAWQDIEAPRGDRFSWDENSTYVRRPPFFDALAETQSGIEPICGARVLGIFGDSVTTDHISPAGTIAINSPAGDYLRERGVARADFNTYGARRGNDELMARGTWANIRLRNLLVPDEEGNVTLYHPTGERMSFFAAAERYQQQDVPLIIIAGKNYGSGSSRDWAAKGPLLLGVRAVLAESFERIHRSNLLGMGILPLQFQEGVSAQTLGLSGKEEFTISLSEGLSPRQNVVVTVSDSSTCCREFEMICRLDIPVEVQYYRDRGMLNTVLKRLLNGAV